MAAVFARCVVGVSLRPKFGAAPWNLFAPSQEDDTKNRPQNVAARAEVRQRGNLNGFRKGFGHVQLRLCRDYPEITDMIREDYSTSRRW